MLTSITRDPSPLLAVHRWAAGVVVGTLLMLAAGLASGCRSAGPSERPSTTPDTKLTVPQERLATHDASGSQFTRIQGAPTLHLTGTRRQMGEAQGEFLRTEIAATLATFVLPYIERTRDRAYYDAATALLADKLAPGDREELEGLAAGAGLPIEEILLLNTFYDIAHAVAGKDGVAEPIACSAIAIDGARATNGGVMIGRNLDWGIRMEGVTPPRTVVLVIHPQAGKPYMMFTWPGMIGGLTGMNTDGVVLAACAVPSALGLNPTTPFPIVMRHVLARATSVDEAHQQVLEEGVTTTHTVLLADTRNTLWVLECSPGRYAVTKANTTPGPATRAQHWIAATSIFTDPALARQQLPPTLEATQRQRRIARTLGVLQVKQSAQDLLRLMRDIRRPERTLQSMVLLPQEQIVYLRRLEDETPSYKALPPRATYGLLEPELVADTR